jgi:integral membrane sensor domain MASE1
MAVEGSEETDDRLTSVLTALARVGSTVGSILAGGTAQLMAAQRHELRRLAAVFAFALAAALFACAATGFAAYSILLALGEEHRAAASALIATGFALLSGIAVLCLRFR